LLLDEGVMDGSVTLPRSRRGLEDVDDDDDDDEEAEEVECADERRLGPVRRAYMVSDFDVTAQFDSITVVWDDGSSPFARMRIEPMCGNSSTCM
jgi:hypothetical protein